ncbi:hypothetical protein ACHAXS_009342 [Conticribra weissflogii]
MGRSQVLRNRTHGRPGQGRGRGRGGGGGRGRSHGNQHQRRGPDPKTLGDNSFRYRRPGGGDGGTGDDDDGEENDDFGFHGDGSLLSNEFDPSIGIGGEYTYLGPAHDTASGLRDDGFDDIGLGRNYDDNNTMSILPEDEFDFAALAKGFSQIPIHERLKVPWHVGRHLENVYGVGISGRKKTLAELREESLSYDSPGMDLPTQTSKDVDDVAARETSPEGNGKDELSALVEGGNDKTKEKGKESSGDVTISKDNEGNLDDGGDDGGEEKEEDLEAWLDDMIS